MASCATPRERAERLVKRANKIFPIDSLVSHVLHVDTLLHYDTTVVLDSQEVKINVPVYKDSIIYNKVTGKNETHKVPRTYKNEKVIDNSKASLTVNTLKDGSLEFNLLLKEQKVNVKGTIPFKYKYITYRKFTTVQVKVKGFFWWIGLGTSILLGLTATYFIIQAIRRIKP